MWPNMGNDPAACINTYRGLQLVTHRTIGAALVVATDGTVLAGVVGPVDEVEPLKKIAAGLADEWLARHVPGAVGRRSEMPTLEVATDGASGDGDTQRVTSAWLVMPPGMRLRVYKGLLLTFDNEDGMARVWAMSGELLAEAAADTGGVGTRLSETLADKWLAAHPAHVLANDEELDL